MCCDESEEIRSTILSWIGLDVGLVKVESDGAVFSEVLFSQAIMTKIKETRNLAQWNDIMNFIVQKCQESVNV